MLLCSVSAFLMQSFDIRAKELLEEYLREKREFESSLSEAELEELQQADLKKRLSKERRRIRAVSSVMRWASAPFR